MCLSIPGKVLAIAGSVATVDFMGVSRELRLELAEEPIRVGDYVLNSTGFILQRVPPEEVDGMLELFRTVLAYTADPAAG